MMDHTPRRLRRLPSALRITSQRSRCLTSLLLMLGLLACYALTGLQAQQPQPPTQPPASPPSVPSPPDPFAGSTSKPDAPRREPRPPLPPPLTFTIDPKTPLKDLLPTPPKSQRIASPLNGNNLSRVPEVQFEAPSAAANAEALKRIAHQMAKINHLNNKTTDGFIDALRSERLDLHGLPFTMGEACRTKGERSKQFALAVALVRRAMQSPQTSGVPVPASPAPPAPVPTSTGSRPTSSTFVFSGRGGTPAVTGPPETPSVAPAPVQLAALVVTADPPAPEVFWATYENLCAQEDRGQMKISRGQRDLVATTRIAALMQILAPLSEMHSGLVKHLSTVSHVEATRALARMAIFSSDEDARKAAIDALKIRRERDYTEILVGGLRYPWPTVARRAAEAIAKLKRKDLLPQLIDVLEQPDPRSPVVQQVKEKRVPVVREMVRVNHHRSCLLCHAPGNTGKVSGDAVKAEVPVPGQPLNPPTGPYNASRQEILVRIDVTYLRQDFSALQAVADANPWPEMQRFDFLVRTRELTEDEAEAYREKLKPREPGEFSPYQRAALSALRELTGRDTEPTPQAWRRLLKLPADSPLKTATP